MLCNMFKVARGLGDKPPVNIGRYSLYENISGINENIKVRWKNESIVLIRARKT